MPISFTNNDGDPIFHGYRWKIYDEPKLAELVGKLLLGQHRHVHQIIDGTMLHPSPTVHNQMIDEIISKLKNTKTPTNRYHRDGWIFQMISWISILLNHPEAMTAIPHSQPAQKGFDNLVIKNFDPSSMDFELYICEDKATESPSNTIRYKVWPEIELFESGKRDNELVNEVTAILERNLASIDVDKCLSAIFWSKKRRYRIAITSENVDDNAERKRIFTGFENTVKGDLNRRRAETIHIRSLRSWFDNFCLKIINYLTTLKT